MIYPVNIRSCAVWMSEANWPVAVVDNRPYEPLRMAEINDGDVPALQFHRLS